MSGGLGNIPSAVQSFASVRNLVRGRRERPHESLDDLTPREFLLTKNRKSLLTGGPTLGTLT